MDPRRRVGDFRTWKISFGDEQQVVPKHTKFWPLEGRLFKVVMTDVDGQQSWGLLESGVDRPELTNRRVWDWDRLMKAPTIHINPGFRRTFVFTGEGEVEL